MEKKKKKVKRANGSSATRGVYAAYMFRPNQKDPVIDELREMLQETYGADVASHMLTNMHEAGGPSVSCMRAWFWGKTRRPTNPAVEAAGRTLGYHRKWVKSGSKETEEE